MNITNVYLKIKDNGVFKNDNETKKFMICMNQATTRLSGDIENDEEMVTYIITLLKLSYEKFLGDGSYDGLTDTDAVSAMLIKIGKFLNKSEDITIESKYDQYIKDTLLEIGISEEGFYTDSRRKAYKYRQYLLKLIDNLEIVESTNKNFDYLYPYSKNHTKIVKYQDDFYYVLDWINTINNVTVRLYPVSEIYENIIEVSVNDIDPEYDYTGLERITNTRKLSGVMLGDLNLPKIRPRYVAELVMMNYKLWCENKRKSSKLNNITFINKNNDILIINDKITLHEFKGINHAYEDNNSYLMEHGYPLTQNNNLNNSNTIIYNNSTLDKGISEFLYQLLNFFIYYEDLNSVIGTILKTEEVNKYDSHDADVEMTNFILAIKNKDLDYFENVKLIENGITYFEEIKNGFNKDDGYFISQDLIHYYNALNKNKYDSNNELLKILKEKDDMFKQEKDTIIASNEDGELLTLFKAPSTFKGVNSKKLSKIKNYTMAKDVVVPRNYVIINKHSVGVDKYDYVDINSAFDVNIQLMIKRNKNERV